MRPVKRVRHSIKSEDEHGLLELQRENRLYFIEKVLEMSEKTIFELENEDDEIDNLENELLLDVISNLQICKHFYKTLYNSTAGNLRKMILSSPFSYMQSVDKDIQLNDWSFLNFSENVSREIMKTFDYFYTLMKDFQHITISLAHLMKKFLPLSIYDRPIKKYCLFFCTNCLEVRNLTAYCVHSFFMR